ncbi:aspartyl-phosphate phosphatase Spo0E family protein [Salirhabdus sp. Marseille-P4669]|uniref:aspartyl-phosphate phosphatase Spo0E family protein n=1 Tax=Salirhabdus sp. Marseille-P4669 TaxID=2042310 RepID=UPI000C7D91FE|nr:aspartyl-phosphate phosphatase Spo0E family protein [Salirhabdus sp. Marseille-P4669]
MRENGMERIESRTLYAKIQQKREKMHEIADDFGLDSVKTLTISQELDELINNYLRTKIQGVKF